MKEVNPKETSRTSAFEMWMNSPMPTYKFLNLMVMWGKYRKRLIVCQYNKEIIYLVFLQLKHHS